MKYIIESPNTLTLTAENFQDRAWLSNFFEKWRKRGLSEYIRAKRESDAGFQHAWDPGNDLNDIISVRFIAPYGEV